MSSLWTLAILAVYCDGREHGYAHGAKLNIRWRKLAEHWIIGVTLGSLIAFGLGFMHPFAPIQIVSQIGADAMVERAADHGASLTGMATQRIVYVTIDDSTLDNWHAKSWKDARPRIAQLTAAARQSGAKVVVLDVEFSLGDPTSEDFSDIAPMFDSSGARLILAAPLDRRITSDAVKASFQLSPPPNYPNPLPAGATYNYPGMNPAIVRSVPAGALVYNEQIHQFEAMPSISVAVIEYLHSLDPAVADPSTLLSDTSDRIPDVPVRFFIPTRQDNPATATTWPWFRIISASQIERNTPALRDAVVVIGQNNMLDSDHHMTPLGNMSGALVHANAIVSMLRLGVHPSESLWDDIIFEFGLVLLMATFTLPYWIMVTFLETWSDSHGEGSLRAAIAFTVETVILVITAILVFCIVAMAIVIMGANALLSGIVFGNLAAVLGVALEAFVHVGNALYKFLHSHAERLVSRVFRVRSEINGVFIVVMVSGLLIPILGRADEVVIGYVQLDKGDRANIIISHPGKPNRVGFDAFDLFAGDRIIITDPGTSAHAMVGGNIGLMPRTVGGITAQAPYTVEESDAVRSSASYFQTLGTLWARLFRDPEAGSGAIPSFGRTRSENGTVNSQKTAEAAASFISVISMLSQAGINSDAISEGRICDQLGVQTTPSTIRFVQTELRERGLYTGGTPDGICGPRTESAISQFVKIVDVQSDQWNAAAGEHRRRSLDVWPDYFSIAPHPFIGFGKFMVDSTAKEYLLAWTGGTGPFSLSLFDPSTKTVVELGTTQTRSVRISIDFPAPGRIIELWISDHGAPNNPNQRQLPAFTIEGVDPRMIPAPDGVPALAVSAWLMTDVDPSWHLEGLRRLGALAEAGNFEAKTILAGLLQDTSKTNFTMPAGSKNLELLQTHPLTGGPPTWGTATWGPATGGPGFKSAPNVPEAVAGDNRSTTTARQGAHERPKAACGHAAGGSFARGC